MRIITVFAVAAMLSACQTRTVVKEVPIEVKVPVAAPCMGQRPEPVEALRDSLSREEWDALTTDQRENLVAAQALLRKIYGDRLTDASAGCR